MRIGVDPGNSGAWVVIVDGVPISCGVMPLRRIGKSNRIDCAALARDISSAIEMLMGMEYSATIERVHSMRAQGVSSTFTFGHAAGAVEGVLAGLGIVYGLVTPQAWKRRAGLIGLDKDASRLMAIKRWPNWGDLELKGRGQALADAAFIAMHCDL